MAGEALASGERVIYKEKFFVLFGAKNGFSYSF
jgi:hypothetical protein